MNRNAFSYLQEWKDRPSRKPLIVRGARQVGKSYLIRQFGTSSFTNVVEINLETHQELIPFFKNKDPRETVRLLALQFSCRIVEAETLLFLDEVQTAPEVLLQLRYFYELLPGLHVIAAGSLLDFMLEEHTFSMPVGRIEYYHLGPMTFGEYLAATGNDALNSFLESYRTGDNFPEPLHGKLSEHFKQYLVVGGMPESISTFIETGSYLETDRVKQSVLTTYLDDFARYRKRVNHSLLETVFRALPRLPGSIVKFSHLSRDFRPDAVSAALHLLSLARICHKVYHTTGEGIPLSATEKKKKMKIIFLDVGLLTSACGLTMVSIENAADLLLINSGSVTEQFIGQHLLYRLPPYREPELHFWSREKPAANAEIDYAIAVGTAIVPIEVKSGATGSLKSLNQFMFEKKQPVAVRFNLAPPSLCRSSGKMPAGDPYDFSLLSLPCYMVEQAERLASEVLETHA